MTSPTSSLAGNTTLAIDTSGSKGSLALGDRQVSWEKKAIHSEIATVKLQELLASAQVPLKSLEKIVVNSGPGSFTGIRVGMNLARTLAYSLNIPVMSFNTLALLASRDGKVGDKVFVGIRAIQNFYYCSGFEVHSHGLDESLAPCSLDESELAAKSADYTKVLIEKPRSDFSPQLEAKVMLANLARWPEQTNFSTWKEVRPVYIRASEAEEKLLKGLLKT